MSSCIKHPRKTSNTLNASVRCEQKRLQRLSETVPANIRIPQLSCPAGNSRPTDQPQRGFTFRPSQSLQLMTCLPYDRTDLEMTWLSWCSGAATGAQFPYQSS